MVHLEEAPRVAVHEVKEAYNAITGAFTEKR